MRASDRAYATLRSDIINWRLTPGTVLGEVELSERLSVSRTPIREALAKLTAEGLSEPQSGRGVVVSEISLDHLEELFELRAALECKAAELAAQRRDPVIFLALYEKLSNAGELITAQDPDRADYYQLAGELDSAVDAAVGNHYLNLALKNLRVHLVRVRRLSKDNPVRLRDAAREHAAIALAIAHGNPAVASAATTVHLDNSLRHLLSTAS
ncbi:GntR family transcriptional regulator [Arthrobacter psychrolactophilus]|uniref:GntR family transcriptional regulator n=1 Tax=Arthrobacter psychrolactophilus TaxID=92442 RepID=A0A2V5J718_9MICC|nr:GntR family transcriptional regulator [Arthrobacter psychrolactophilus]PYI38540.1 GntR family transcriptional regulator [Arthrobacter psychrolactophilus]